jgi:DNA topoisomerase III
VKLFICEKPSQAKEIAPHVGARTRGDGCITGAGVTVTWCIGHLLEQAKPDHYVPALRAWDLALLPVLPQAWEMNIKDSVKKQYVIVKRLLGQASQVVIATDADREGEVIAREVMQLCRFTGPVQRLWLSALNDASIKQALSKLLPGSKTLPMYYSGLGRARADWLAGMNMTMALTTGFGVGRGSAGVLHCGRVQTPVLALIVRRERHIAAFKPTTYFELEAKFQIKNMVVPMMWVADPSLLDNLGHCRDESSAKAVAARINGKAGVVSKVLTTPEREQIPLLHSLGSLQREASAKFGLKAQAVLDACQALYETHKATTYPRTDCEYLPVSMHSEAAGVIASIGQTDPALKEVVQLCTVQAMSRAFNDKKITAHHAIVPIANAKVNISAMKPAEKIVFGMVCRRYLAQFLGDHLFDKTVMMVRCAEADFRATGKIVRTPGWKRAYPTPTPTPASPGTAQTGASKPAKNKTADEDIATEVALPQALEGDAALAVGQEIKRCTTKAPKRYTEGTLLAAMESIDKEIEDPRWRQIMRNKEKAGIGTDATRSAVIENLFSREYIGNQAKSIIPTERGMGLIELIERVAPALADPVLTAQWEDRLSQVESGEVLLETFESELGTWLNRLVEQVRIQASASRAQAPRSQPNAAVLTGKDAPVSASSVPCPLCSAFLQRKSSAKGYFWGCSSYQQTKCRGSMNDLNGLPDVPKTKAVSGSDKAGNVFSASVAAQALKPASIPSSRLASKTTSAAVPTASLPAADVSQAPSCVACNRAMTRREGARGAFWGCSGFPDCRTTQPYGEVATPVPAAAATAVQHDGVRPAAPAAATNPLGPAKRPLVKGKIGEKCPTCLKGMLTLKSLPTGKGFAGCTKFPDCRHFQYV